MPARPFFVAKAAGNEASRLHDTLFNPDRLQEIFVDEIEKLITSPAN
jgi:hypothetical protein